MRWPLATLLYLTQTPPRGQLFLTMTQEIDRPSAGDLLRPRTSNPRSRAAWSERRARLREALRLHLGLELEHAELRLEPAEAEPVPIGRLELRRVAFVTGSFMAGAWGWWIQPAAAVEQLPAVLWVRDRPELDFSWWEELAGPVELAGAGFAVLTLAGSIHEQPATGFSTAGFLAWNHLRALDFLQRFRLVDRTLIGLVALPGGVDLATTLCALDDRLGAAVLTGHTGYHADDRPAPGALDRVSLAPPGILRVADRPELIACFAPRPLLLLAAASSGTSEQIAAAQCEILSVYGLFGRGDYLTINPQPAAGSHLPQAASQWLRDRLVGRVPPRGAGQAPAADALETVGPRVREELQALLQQHQEHHGLSLTAQSAARWCGSFSAAQPPKLSNRAARKNYQDRLRGELRAVLGCSGGEVPLLPLPIEMEGPAEAAAERLDDAEWLSIRTEDEQRASLLFSMPAGDGPHPAVVVIGGLADWPFRQTGATTQIAAYLAHGCCAAFLFSRLGFGEASVEERRAARLAGRPGAGMAVRDTIAAVDYLYRRREVDLRRIAVVGVGAAGIVALLAAGLDERIAAVAADAGGTTYRDGGEGLPEIWGILRVADVPQIASLAAPRPLWLYHVPEDRVGFSSRRYFDWTRRTYQSLGAEEALRMETLPQADAAGIAGWLRGVWKKR